MKPTEEKIHTDPSDLPIYLFKQGNNCEAYRYFGAHIETRAGESGVVFRVWAPHAAAISVVGDFNSWKPGSHPMHKVDQDSVWELFIPGMKEYDVYKYCVTTRAGDLVYKADPYAFHAETRPSNGSKVYDLNGFAWHDAAWQEAQKKADVINGPMNIYEMHTGSWKTKGVASSASAKTVSKLKKGRYVVQVRAYRLKADGTRIYGAWSAKKSVRVK